MPQNPLVSIGVPVFNEERFLKHSLESLVKQDYPNIEIIISDNCSTDGSSEICKIYEQNFEHVKYNKTDTNIGAAENFRNLQESSNGKYFMWAAGHDLWSSNLISSCVALLEENENAVITFASSEWINESGGKISKQSGWQDTRGMGSCARFFSVFWGNMHPVLGVIRNESLRDCDKFKSVLGADLILLCELALKGDFIHATDALWSRRLFRDEESYSQRVKRYKSKSYNLIENNIFNIFPIIHLPIEIIKVVFRAPIKFHIKMLIVITLLPTMLLKYITSK